MLFLKSKLKFLSLEIFVFEETQEPNFIFPKF